MYGSIPDPYCYRGTTVLRNRAGFKDQIALDLFEAAMVAQRFEEPLPVGRLTTTHYRAIHRHLFGDIYAWAGRLRTVRISKGGSAFCYPEHIKTELEALFEHLRRDSFLRGLSRQIFCIKAAHVLAELNAIHPFREGNGRTQLAFLVLLASQADHPLKLSRLDPQAVLEATIMSFNGNETRLQSVLRGLI